METTIRYGGQGRDYRLNGAILIYTDTNNKENVAATVHDVDLVGTNHRPVIKPGQPVSIVALEQLMRSLGHNTGAGFIRENILSLGMDRMAWWCPAGHRRIWFKPSHDGEDDEYKPLKKVNGKFVHHPPLVFVVQHGNLNVYAMTQDRRPTPDTRLYRAPYWNLREGHMCNGNLKLPIIAPENIDGFEKAFFDSQFTHGGGDGVLTRHTGGHGGLWTELAKRKHRPKPSFWSANLVRSNQTLKSILK